MVSRGSPSTEIMDLNSFITSVGFFDTIIFAGTQSVEASGIIRSTDSGMSWSRVDSFSFQWSVNCFLTKNDTIFGGINGGGLSDQQIMVKPGNISIQLE
jgi:hypothetical protein